MHHRQMTTASWVLALLVCAAGGQEKDAGEGRVIRPKDHLVITVSDLEGPGKKTEVKRAVDEKGRVQVPRVKEPVTAKGLTREKLEKAIAQAYRDARVIQNATVTVTFGKDNDAERLIRPKDRLLITVHDLEGPGVKTAAKRTLDEKGEVLVPQVRTPVAADGLTCEKLERSIVKAYRDANLIANALVTVEFGKEEEKEEGGL